MIEEIKKMNHDDLINFIEDYFIFYKRVYEIDNDINAYYKAVQEMNYYFLQHQLNKEIFSTFQLDLIKLGFINHYSLSQLETYILPNISDEEMEQLYQSL